MGFPARGALAVTFTGRNVDVAPAPAIDDFLGGQCKERGKDEEDNEEDEEDEEDGKDEGEYKEDNRRDGLSGVLWLPASVIFTQRL